MENSKFIIEEIIDINDNNTFSLVDDDMKNKATVVIKDKKIGLYFEDDKIEEFGDDYEAMLDRVNELGYKFIKLINGNHRWKKYNPNPKNRNTGDCTIRAYCAAFNLSWEEAYDEASLYAKEEKYILDATPIVKKIVVDHFGCQEDEEYKKTKSKDRMTVNTFAMSHPYGTYIVHIRGHLVTVKNGEYWDSWDSGDKKIDAIYKVV